MPEGCRVTQGNIQRTACNSSTQGIEIDNENGIKSPDCISPIAHDGNWCWEARTSFLH